MKTKYTSLFVIIFISVFCACSSSSGKESGKALQPQESLLDTIPSVTVEEEPVETKPDLSTTQLQLQYMNESDNSEDYSSGILPQMAEDAPEYCEEILTSGGKRFIIVDKARMKLFLYDPYGNIEKSYGIACAKNYGTKHKKGDSRTTEGIFKVKGVFDSTEWLFTDDDGYTSPTKGQYGPRFIRLTIPYIGIHGTGNPGSIGKRCSHGCIRVTNKNIMELVEYVEPGMPVIISPGPRDMAVNLQEKTKVLSVSTVPGEPKAVAGKIGNVTPEAKPAETAAADSTSTATDNKETPVMEVEVEQPQEATSPKNEERPEEVE